MYYQKITDPTVTPTQTDDYITSLGKLMYVRTDKIRGWATHDNNGWLRVDSSLQPQWWLKPLTIPLSSDGPPYIYYQISENESIENIIKVVGSM